MRILLIANPRAGHKRGGKIVPQLENLFGEKNIQIDLRLTEHPGHGLEIASEVSLRSYDGLLAAGGDGMAFEIINGYFQNQSANRIPIGFIPTGTGNAFVRDLGFTKSDWSGIVEAVACRNTKRVDVGFCKTTNQNFYFVNILGFGFVADVAKTAHKLKVFGDISYLLGVFYQTIRLRAYHLKLEFDGNAFEQENTFVEISNTRYTGANFLMAPNAKIDDGLLDITILSKLSRRRVFACLPKIFTGEHIYLPEVKTWQAKKIKIATETPKILTPDGELLGSTPIEVECLPQAVEVFGQ